MVLCLKKFRKIAVGVVVRDEHRLFIGALSSLEDMGTDAEEAEVMAVMRATEFAATVCSFGVIIEGCLLQRFQALNSAGPNLSKIEHLLDLVKHNGLFSGRSVSHMSEGRDA
ncbi:hypothetical protein ACB098_09G032200 [Castanea mollissima]